MIETFYYQTSTSVLYESLPNAYFAERAPKDPEKPAKTA